jgi:antitoxin FitA
MQQFAYDGAMALVQVRDVSDETVNALRARAAEQGLTLAAYLRAQLDRLARQPTNAEIVQRLARRSRTGNPTVDETVAEIRRLRDVS